MSTLGKRVCWKQYRGFESLPVRHDPTPVRRGGVVAFKGGAENPLERSETGLKANVARSDESITTKSGGGFCMPLSSYPRKQVEWAELATVKNHGSTPVEMW